MADNGYSKETAVESEANQCLHYELYMISSAKRVAHLSELATLLINSACGQYFTLWAAADEIKNRRKISLSDSSLYYFPAAFQEIINLKFTNRPRTVL